MIYRILRWLGWGRPPEKPTPKQKSSVLRRLQNSSARNAVDKNRRPPRGGTGTAANHSKKQQPAVKPDNSPPS